MPYAASDNSRIVLESNQTVAQGLDEVADLLEGKGVNPFRVKAYRTAAETVRGLTHPVSEVLRMSGLQGLIALPGIGESLARSIEKLTVTGELPLLTRLRGRSGSEAVLKTVPGIGPKTAHRIHLELGIESLGDLEAAAHDGRLAAMPGMGRKRVRAVCESLAGRFGVKHRPLVEPAPKRPSDPPSVEELLSLDAEYRKKGKAGRLLKIAPLRFNPTAEAWLPILHARRENRRYTVLFSNSAHAHDAGAVGDWVVIYREDKGADGQWTVVTDHRGPLQGRRIVRGRETECLAHYSHMQSEAPALF